jgi:hypothetical protein
MLNELDQPAFVEVVEKAFDIGIKNLVHFLLQERIRQRIQRLMLAAPRSKTIREAEKIFLIILVEEGDHCLLDDFVLQLPRLPTVVSVHLLSRYKLFERAAPGTLRDVPGCADP